MGDSRRPDPQGARRQGGGLAAELIKDRAVFEQPVVRQEFRRQVDREYRQKAAEWNRENGIPTRTTDKRDKRRMSGAVNRMFWVDVLMKMRDTTKLLSEAAGELERTGLPNEHSGDIVKAAISLQSAVERLRKTATARAVGVRSSSPTCREDRDVGRGGRASLARQMGPVTMEERLFLARLMGSNKMLTTAKLAERLRTSVNTIHYWRGRGTGPPGVRVGKRVLYRWGDVETWLEQRNR